MYGSLVDRRVVAIGSQDVLFEITKSRPHGTASADGGQKQISVGLVAQLVRAHP